MQEHNMFLNKEGHQVPSVSFPLRKEDSWTQRTTEDVFANKTVVLFSLPGAFTPTCSSSHLPRYDELAPKLFANGVDEIVCLSVNDTFVMNAWSADQNTQSISFLPDGNGEFTEAMGLLVDKKDLGFGKRSWRYSMLVENGTIKKMFIEPDLPGDPFEVSDADTMLNYINPEATQTDAITIFTKPGCPFCKKAKELLIEKGLQFEKLTLGEEITLTGFRAIANSDAVPQIFINGQHIGGSEELSAHFSK